MNFEEKLSKSDIVYLPKSPKTLANIINEKFSDKKLVLYGGGVHSKELIENLNNKNNIVAIIDDNPSKSLFNKCMNIDELKRNNIEFDYIVISNHLYSKIMYKKLLSFFNKNKILNLYDLKYKSYFPFYKFKLKTSKQNLIIISLFENADHFSRNAKLLSQHFNMYKVLISGDKLDNNKYYKDVFLLNTNLLSLIEFLKYNKNKIDLVALNLVPGSYYLFYLIKYFAPNAKVVVSIIDWINLYGDKNIIKKYIHNAECSYEAVDDICKYADGIINSLGGKVFEEKILSKQKNGIQYFNYLPKEYFKFKQKELSNPIKLVYAGGIAPTNQSNDFFEDIKMIKVFKPLLKQAFKIETFLSFDYSNRDDIAYKDYYELEKQYNFKINKALKIDKLIDYIQNFDFALMVYDFKKTKKLGILKEHLASVLPSKVFSYLSAGLPIIVSEELEFVASFVKKHNIGIVVSQNEIYNLEEVIQKYDYKILKENVKKLQEKICIECNFDSLYNFLSTIKDFDAIKRIK